MEQDEEAIDPRVAEALLERRFGPFDLFRESIDRELGLREPEWDAFSAAVERRIDQEHRAEARLGPEARAVVAFGAQLDAEVAELGPRFDGEFKAQVERRIWLAAKAGPSIFARASASLAAKAGRSIFARASVWPAGSPHPWRRLGLATALAAGLAAASAVAIGVVRERGESSRLGPGPAGPEAKGSVAVDRVSFEGTVTVMREDGMTVVWLADAS